MSDDLPGARIAAALVAFQAEMPTIRKTEQGVIQGKDGKQGYRYSYADLAGVSEQVYPLLTKHGLGFTAFPTLTDDGKFVLSYKLLHTSGEFEAGRYPLPMGLAAQATGSAITYARRYCLVSVTGVAPEDDDGDAATHQAATPPAAARPPDLPADVVAGREAVGKLWAELAGTKQPDVVALAKAYADATEGADIWKADGPALRKFAGALSAGGIEVPKAGSMASGAAPGTPERGAAPPTDDPAEAEPLGDGQRKAIFAALGKLGVRDDVESRYTLGTLAGRVLESRSDLTKADGRRISNQLRNVKTREQLEQVLAQAEQAAADG